MDENDGEVEITATYPKNVTPKCAFWLPLKLSLSDISVGGAWASPGAYVYILNHLHRSGAYLGNHYQLPLMAITWVTYMLIFM